jgi:hypothetical protein
VDRKIREKASSVSGLQFGNGKIAGAEILIHTLRNLYTLAENDCILALDATNAFGEIKRKVMLETIQERIPELYLTSWNLYGQASYTVINGESVPVERGVHQGCPLAGTLFCLAIAPLIDEVNSNSNGASRFYMDDGFNVGNVKEVGSIWKKIVEKGPKYGFIVNNKSKILIKPNILSENTKWYNDNVEVNKEGIETLGAPIGSEDFVAYFCKDKFEGISEVIDQLSIMAKLFPQHAFRIFSQSTKFRLNYLVRTAPNAHQHSESYRVSVRTFVESIFGSQLEDAMMDQISPPINEGGLGIDVDIKALGEYQFSNSIKALNPAPSQNKY